MTKRSVLFQSPQSQLAIRPEMVMGTISYCLVPGSAIPRIEKCLSHLLRPVSSTEMFHFIFRKEYTRTLLTSKCVPANYCSIASGYV